MLVPLHLRPDDATGSIQPREATKPTQRFWNVRPFWEAEGEAIHSIDYLLGLRTSASSSPNGGNIPQAVRRGAAAADGIHAIGGDALSRQPDRLGRSAVRLVHHGVHERGDFALRARV